MKIEIMDVREKDRLITHRHRCNGKMCVNGVIIALQVVFFVLNTSVEQS